jgi:hypothetical protein
VTKTSDAPEFLPPDPVVRLVRDRILDAELAALLTIAVEGGIPVLVAGVAPAARRAVRDALVVLVPRGVRVVRLAADEDFAWMPQAVELGWRPTSATSPQLPGAVMVAALEGDAADGTWGDAARLAIRALTAGHSLLATVGGSGLDDVLRTLGRPPVSAADDELSRLGVVLVLGAAERVEIAHYLRPVARDPGGHVQRLPPAALAAWNMRTGRYDHFAWGILAELASRTGRRPLAFEREQARRAASISAAAAGP